jgi:threonine aldolase
MNFASDNAYGAAPEMFEALRMVNEGSAASYGEDAWTMQLELDLARIFEHEVAVFPVITGTAANALALSTLAPSHGAIFCHRDAHIATDECGAPELFTHGAKLVCLEGGFGRITPDGLENALSHVVAGSVHHSQPACVSITQASELGTCYRPEDIHAIASIARRHGMALHMDGARLANAIAFLGCTPAEATWKTGVDALSLGMTKNGALAAEAVVFFGDVHVRDFAFRRKKFGHLLSKLRFVSAQLACAFEDDRWLAWARRANALARSLAERLAGISGIAIVNPVEANLVFVSMPETLRRQLRSRGAQFYDWGPPRAGSRLVRFVTSFATPEEDIDRLIAAVSA